MRKDHSEELNVIYWEREIDVFHDQTPITADGNHGFRTGPRSLDTGGEDWGLNRAWGVSGEDGEEVGWLKEDDWTIVMMSVVR